MTENISSLIGLFSALKYLLSNKSALLGIVYPEYDVNIYVSTFSNLMILRNTNLLNPKKEELKTLNDILALNNNVEKITVGKTVFYDNNTLVPYDNELDLLSKLESIRKNDKLYIIVDKKIKISFSNDCYRFQYREGGYSTFTKISSILNDLNIRGGYKEIILK